MKRTIAQWSIFSTLFLAGFMAFLILCGEDNPEQPMSDTVFFGLKLAAGVVLYFCIIAGKYFNHRGLLPEIINSKKDKQED